MPSMLYSLQAVGQGQNLDAHGRPVAFPTFLQHMTKVPDVGCCWPLRRFSKDDGFFLRLGIKLDCHVIICCLYSNCVKFIFGLQVELNVRTCLRRLRLSNDSSLSLPSGMQIHQVLSDYDPDAAAQEMIVEQFIVTGRRINTDESG